ncbi:unnamed protein product [Prorocentrum cordatum]|uniref:Uncharacterized protein n=1 Tax=Prorocentrum cordatum TaxID=2364126 RepID=A0ABN9WCR5_9DINO|nr:unnamed protein product [Polarella glacialis]
MNFDVLRVPSRPALLAGSRNGYSDSANAVKYCSAPEAARVERAGLGLEARVEKVARELNLDKRVGELTRQLERVQEQYSILQRENEDARDKNAYLAECLETAESSAMQLQAVLERASLPASQWSSGSRRTSPEFHGAAARISPGQSWRGAAPAEAPRGPAWPAPGAYASRRAASEPEAPAGHGHGPSLAAGLRELESWASQLRTLDGALANRELNGISPLGSAVSRSR